MKPGVYEVLSAAPADEILSQLTPSGETPPAASVFFAWIREDPRTENPQYSRLETAVSQIIAGAAALVRAYTGTGTENQAWETALITDIVLPRLMPRHPGEHLMKRSEAALSILKNIAASSALKVPAAQEQPGGITITSGPSRYDS